MQTCFDMDVEHDVRVGYLDYVCGSVAQDWILNC